MLAVRIVLFVFLISSAVSLNPLRSSTSNYILNRINAGLERSTRTRAPLDACYTYSCASVGQSCAANTTVVPPNIPICLGSYCDSTSQVCVALLADGQSCTSGQQCSLSSYCNSTSTSSGICRPQTSSEPAGGICKVDSDCEYGTCSSGICNGVAAGGACDNDDQCNPPNLCTASVCTPPLALGASCDVTNDKCGQPIAYCVPSTTGVSATCQSFASGTVGSPCTDQTYCPDGTGCFGVNSTNLVGTCVTPKTSSQVICGPTNSSTVCGQYEDCNCNGVIGTEQCFTTVYPNPTGYRAKATAALNCVTSKCNTASAACVQSTCLNEYCSFLDTLYDEEYLIAQGLYPTCLINYYLSGIPLETGCPANTATGSSSASAVCRASAAVMGLLAAGAVLV